MSRIGSTGAIFQLRFITGEYSVSSRLPIPTVVCAADPFLVNNSLTHTGHGRRKTTRSLAERDPLAGGRNEDGMVAAVSVGVLVVGRRWRVRVRHDGLDHSQRQPVHRVMHPFQFLLHPAHFALNILLALAQVGHHFVHVVLRLQARNNRLMQL